MLLTDNIVFSDLIDAANINTIIKFIVSITQIIVNKNKELLHYYEKNTLYTIMI